MKTSGIHKTRRIPVQVPEPHGTLLRALAAVGERLIIQELQIAIRERAQKVGLVIPEDAFDEINDLDDVQDQEAIREILDRHGVWPPKEDDE